MTGDQGRLLLSLARAAIAAEFGGPPVKCPKPCPAWLSQPLAAFVSLHRHGELRGCVGSLSAQRPLFDEVVGRATDAAFRDGRMVSVQQDELPKLVIDVSVLAPLEPIGARTEEELLSNLRPGLDGLVLHSREGSAVFIPVMWKQLPEPKSFLLQLKRKAGLYGWPKDLRAQRFTAEDFSEAGKEAGEKPGEGAR